MHYLVFHLTLADAIVCFVTMPMETIWRYMDEVPPQYVILYLKCDIFEYKRGEITIYGYNINIFDIHR